MPNQDKDGRGKKMKSVSSFETTRMMLPSTPFAIAELPALIAASTANAITQTLPTPVIESSTSMERSSAELALTRNRRTGEEVALTMHFNDEKISLERQVEQDIKKLQTQLKLLQTDLLPSPVRPRVNYIEELINSLVKDFKQLLNAHTTELELYTHRVGSAQLLTDADYYDPDNDNCEQ
jgi:hypothetical protein